MRYLTDSASAPSSLHSPPAAITSTDPRSLQPSQSRIESLPLWNDPLMPLEGQSPVSDDHGPSLLHSILGVADVTPVHPTLRHLQSKGVHFYSRHDNNDNNSKGTRLPRNQALQTVMDVLIDPTAELEFSDYAYVLAIIDQAVSSQQQFWTILSHFVRRTITKESEDTKFWKVRLGKYVIPVYRSQDRSIFLQQLARLDGEVKEACKEKDDGSHEEGGEEGRRKPLLTDQYILGKLMVESLVYPATDDKEAALLFDALNVHGQIRFHKDVFGTLVKRATLMHSAPQISLLGEIMLRHEALFAQNKVPSRPLLIHRTYMDNYLLKACELGFETLARDVFQASLAAGRCHRTSSFNIILNSYSTKQFGPVSFASTAQLRQQRRRQQRQDIDPHRSTSKRSGDNDSGNFNTLQERLAALRVGKFGRSMLTTHLEPVDKLVREMEQFGVVPDMGTLNILVKLYLEVDLQGIHESRHWQEVFTRYNPADLEPDTVTCNTLLAYYERKRDLVMMRTIYESMTTAEEVGSVVKTRRQRRKEARESDQQPEQPLPKKEEDVLVKSQRDVFTYNTMLYALLRHAKDPTDMAAIGQVFYDMEQDGIPADTVTFNTNIMFHIRRGDFVAAMQVYQDMYEQPAVKDKEETLVRDHPTRRRRTIQKSLPTWTRQPSSTALSTEPLDNTPSDSLSNLSIPKSLSRAFTPTPPTRDSITYTSLMSGYGQSNQMEIATFFFSEMVRLGLEPNFKTYSTLVAGLERAGDFQRAQTLWDMVLKEGKLTPKERKLVEALCLSSKQS
ncbi:hypothetical protein DFQ27_001347 [Actinomortierella ambigua]|uniref:Pentatricopeptide repeat-containing protein n=1 Tax=Actinomortierella ambigua TaxID=1343610 RepID=A0A9P6U8M1_9FUNG|nr:hypothetical protein DFQ27_001347 [Actinomortierella ambigua]